MHLFPSFPQFLGLPLPALSFNIMVQKTHKKAEIIQQTITSTRTTWAYNNIVLFEFQPKSVFKVCTYTYLQASYMYFRRANARLMNMGLVITAQCLE